MPAIRIPVNGDDGPKDPDYKFPDAFTNYGVYLFAILCVVLLLVAICVGLGFSGGSSIQEERENWVRIERPSTETQQRMSGGFISIPIDGGHHDRRYLGPHFETTGLLSVNARDRAGSYCSIALSGSTEISPVESEDGPQSAKVPQPPPSPSGKASPRRRSSFSL